MNVGFQISRLSHHVMIGLMMQIERAANRLDGNFVWFGK